ncbi:MAG: hypothetical protein A3D93_02320 [Acidobacteria bacterium RIFCSPHIGHO2_12_FULL_67_30]|nr:MAG: hypothetical protein A2620_04810 [Acidobacteria bacterium RIFCSPHIGHO2_01_FULL_67_28]OFV89909.1 MAG: hypothetical protein A3D93_02320 [Acidobacteria bacterium RIFCSPHIGHO2_12_FULL_67_30]
MTARAGLPGFRRTLAVVLAGALAAAALAAAEAEVRVEVQVTAEATGEPVEGAAIYLKFKEERFLRKDKRMEWRVKTNKDGKAVFPPIPEGVVLVQVIAKGWKTYGEYHTLEGPKQLLEIKLKPPKKWF